MSEQLVRIGFIGAGNMATAMIKGIIKSKVTKPEYIWIFDIDQQKALQLTSKYGVSMASSDIELVNECTIVIPSVKPQYISEVLTKIREHLTDKHLIISIAAGISLETIKEILQNKCSVVRTMPNTPALVGEGMTAICIDKTVSNEHMTQVKSLFQSFGRIELIDESHIHAATAISGSSPAYGFLFIEALADGGVLMGLSREQSYRMAAQSLLGAAKMVLETGQHPGSLKDMVCSPGGTTIEAVASLEQDGFRSSIIEAVRLCAEKSALMGRNKGK